MDPKEMNRDEYLQYLSCPVKQVAWLADQISKWRNNAQITAMLGRRDLCEWQLEQAESCRLKIKEIELKHARDKS